MSTLLRQVAPITLMLGLAAPAGTQISRSSASLVLPPGATFPVLLHQTLRAGKSLPGEPVAASTAQRVPSGNASFSPRGVQLTGELLSSQAQKSPGDRAARLQLRFDTIVVKGRTFSIRTRILAIANFTEVEDTSAPTSTSGDRGNASPADWTTRQIGGDVVTRSGWIGEVDNMVMQKVGFSDFEGVYADPSSSLRIPRALGQFSSTAHGLYGFSPDTTLDSELGLVSVSGSTKLSLRSGDELLLLVLP